MAFKGKGCYPDDLLIVGHAKHKISTSRVGESRDYLSLMRRWLKVLLEVENIILSNATRSDAPHGIDTLFGKPSWDHLTPKW